MKQFFHYILVASILLGCEKEKHDYAYVGGEIINPSTNFVVLSKSDAVLDTIKLDANNRFVYKIENLHPGLYTFKHGGQVQIALLEPSDSIMFRLNMLDFDESLVFTGKGDKKNNYLINDFLQSEAEEKEVFKFCQLSPVKFEQKIDSIKAGKLLKLEEFQKKYKTSELFNNIALTSINNNYYNSKEIYPFVNYGNNKRAILNSLPEDFYAYRETIDYNNDLNKDYFNYYSFLRNTFDNISLNKHLSHSDESENFNQRALCYNLDRLEVVDSVISNNTIKDNRLLYYTMKFLSRSENSEENYAILESFLGKSNNDDNKSTLSAVVKSLDNLKPGNNFPNVELVDLNNNEIKLSSLDRKLTVIYFWSKVHYDHFKASHRKAKELTTKYPEVSFLAVNVDEECPDLFIESMRKNRFVFENELKFKHPKEAKLELAVYPLTRTIVLNKENKIVTSSSNIFYSNFEEQLLGLLNQ
ncbi:peroxiredoxin family protein [Flavobacteriaceae bacterium XHP0103]|uniref:TlpA family protein disulfide reductase n=1 Tax=Marixanthotalea marina TaxID=2844359 RepID=UPI002989A706|nr:hypothetical protein [Marixanthotalea marina]MBU3822371.1 peroxiredoxin family protein [Marixanthotalea marina]